jgi:hypothetical protein
MPQSKKPRRRYNPHKALPPTRLVFPQWYLDNFKNAVQGVSLNVLSKLHRGEMTPDDMACLRDVINLAIVGMYSRPWLDLSLSEEAVMQVRNCHAAFTSLWERYEKTGSPVCRGNELTPIEEGICVIEDFILDSVDQHPHRVLKEWCKLREAVDEAPPGDKYLETAKVIEKLKGVK